MTNPDKPWLEEGDKNDPEVRRLIERHEREARKHLRDLFHRYRKSNFDGQINGVANTIGIMAAELIHLGCLTDRRVGEAMSDVFLHHIENALIDPNDGEEQEGPKQ